MLRIIIWAVWLQLIVAILFITLMKLPCRFTMSKGQIYIHTVSSYGKSNNHKSSYAVGTIANWNKPIHLSIAGLMKSTDKFGSEQEFIAKYVNTGVPLDVFVCRAWEVSYDVAFPDFKDDSQFTYTTIEWVIIDMVLILICVFMYFYLTKRKKKTVLSILLIFWGLSNSYAQAEGLDQHSYPLLAVETVESNTSLRIYGEGTIIKKVYQDTLDVSLETPEHVLASIASSTSVAWDKFHSEDNTASAKSATHYSKVAEMSLQEPVFELDYVLEIDEGAGNGFAFVRFGILGMGERKPKAGYFFIKTTNFWRLESKKRSIEENYALLILKPDILYALLVGEKEGEDTGISVLRDQIKVDQKVNLTKLGRLVWSWFQPGSERPDLVDKFCENPNWN